MIWGYPYFRKHPFQMVTLDDHDFKQDIWSCSSLSKGEDEAPGWSLLQWFDHVHPYLRGASKMNIMVVAHILFQRSWKQPTRCTVFFPRIMASEKSLARKLHLYLTTIGPFFVPLPWFWEQEFVFSVSMLGAKVGSSQCIINQGLAIPHERIYLYHLDYIQLYTCPWLGGYMLPDVNFQN